MFNKRVHLLVKRILTNSNNNNNNNNNNNINKYGDNNNNHLFSGICKLKGILFRVFVESKPLPSVFIVNEQLVL